MSEDQQKIAAKKELKKLVDNFKEHIESYKASDYNESTLRIDYLNKFFKLLGWDVSNEQNLPPSYREVVTEDRVHIEGRSKAPDYAFRLTSGKRLFFAEAKKPSVNIAKHADSAFQLRRYGWSADLPVSLLTNFEYLSIYDCTIKPIASDLVSKARLDKVIHFEDYLDKFDYIWERFSKYAVHNGSLSEHFGSKQKRRGSASVDDDFLDSLDGWRIALAKDINENNSLDEDRLNYIVQQTIDRIIFLRIAEDRDVEDYGAIQKCLDEKNHYKNLYKLFLKADRKYNSGLFKEDDLSAKVKINDSIIAKIIKGLYYPKSPYEFSVLPIEILGKAYEQFLGKKITLTNSGNIKIEDKPEVRKAGGVYYTPRHIVEYIVRNTVGKYCEGRSPEAIADLKILDPASGSGSFLICAYEYLLNWHKDYYIKNKEKISKKKINEILTPQGELTTKLKGQVLLNNIFGVDIDANAVEVTKLSLLLKCMEGETKETVNAQFSFFQERILPTLDNNIKCGNSLIDFDIYTKYPDLNDDIKVKRKINAFNWKTGFKEIFQQGRFDVIIGNPPWGADINTESIGYFRNIFTSAKMGTVDSYAIFVEKSLELLKSSGLLGFIIPDTFLRKDDFQSFRELLLTKYSIPELIETGPVFSQVRDTWCSVIFINASEPSDKIQISHKKISRFIVSAEERLAKFGKNDWDEDTSVKQSIWRKKNKMIIGYRAYEIEQKILDKIEKNPVLGEISKYKISRGEEGSKLKIKESASGSFEMIIPENIEKYFVGSGKRISTAGLTKNKVISIYQKPKIWIIRIQKMRWPQRIVAGLDDRTNTAGMKTLQSITADGNNLKDLLFLNSLLSSKLINYWCINYLADDINQSYLSKIPVQSANKSGSSIYEQIVKLTSQIIKLKEQRHRLTHGIKLAQFDREIEFCEDNINKLIYDLYDLTNDEIQIIERALN